METFFNIRYEFDRSEVHRRIADRVRSGEPGYICVADGNILCKVHLWPDYRDVVNGAMFSICDSGYVPLYLRWIYGIKRSQYRGSDIFRDIVRSAKYRMAFVGTDRETLDRLRRRLTEWNPAVADMLFMDLPFRRVEEFDYGDIAHTINSDGAEIIFVALGAPKQERFMNRLNKYLTGGRVMLGVGAAFNFLSGNGIRHAPGWIVAMRLEFVYRLFQEPRKQFKKLFETLPIYPGIFKEEISRRNNGITQK